MALALYRKYRPATFSEVVGQEHVTDPLRVALSAGRVNHAYLFSGPRGCGKTSSARILARSLNCVKGPTPDPCGECNSCIGLAPNGTGSVDVVELDAASHGGVEDARDLRDKAFYAPAESRYRVFIIDEAHMVTTQGFNALLKIVEEPPEHLIFIFATTEPDKVLPTIRSRTHHYPFRLIPPGVMRSLLERNCAAEGVAVEPSVFPLVIRAGGGSARDTQSVMDQLLSGAGPDGVKYERAISLLGVTDSALINDVVDGLSAGDGAAVYGTIDRLVDAGHDPRRFASDLLDRLRDLVLLCAVPDAADRNLVSAPEDELATMSAQAERIGPAALTRYAEIVHQGLVDMRGATAPRLLLELLVSRMLLPSVSQSEAALLQRLEQLERRPPAAIAATSGDPAAPTGGPVFTRRSQQPADQPPAQPEPQRAAPTPVAVAAPVSAQPAPAATPAPAAVPTPAPAQPAPPLAAPAATPQPAAAAPAPSAPAASGGMDATAVRRIWSELLAAVRATSRSTEAMLTNATVGEVDGNVVTITHTSAPLARRLAEPRNTEAIAAALSSVLGGTWQVRCTHGTPGATPQQATQVKAARPAPIRPSQAQNQQARPQPEPQQTQAPRPPQDDVPPPPEPPEPDDPLPPEPDDEEAMLAEAARPADPGSVNEVQAKDPESVMLQLLADELGARPLKKA
ncbi:DNA polymerase III subunit gamma and tau [Lentzea sp. NEAU-D7]|uniref:DNA polymerase III subunit gamma and tau n=1 Tax=Lentzea sp. NEAU-D7 TaxID=2994667 RepID=UPI00224ACE2E|nr:DNA polymerase III subunit gamma and tau [Lentzea sp. NEAU-D7]MCX2952381.1 DNA polymerase III subunit gamma and tau [Lentzea sp. NEAU-D7]